MEAQLRHAAETVAREMDATRTVLAAIGGDAFTDEERHAVQQLCDVLSERQGRVRKAMERAERSSAGIVLRARVQTLDRALTSGAPEALLAIFRTRHTELLADSHSDDAEAENAIREALRDTDSS